jgi:galactokinase/mevalonate kinase-like predicted kinase
VCGAGGGGCMFCYGPPRKRTEIAAAVAGEGARVLDYTFERHGLSRG